VITGIYYSASLEVKDWGKISGKKGRNTKVTGMRASGKRLPKYWFLKNAWFTA
jgi:hypothetical protein